MGIPFGGFRKSRRSLQESRNTGSSEPSSNESDAFGGPAAIPITPDLISAHPIKSILMIGKGCRKACHPANLPAMLNRRVYPKAFTRRA